MKWEENKKARYYVAHCLLPSRRKLILEFKNAWGLAGILKAGGDILNVLGVVKSLQNKA